MKKLVLLLGLCSLPAFAQNTRVDGIALTRSGLPAPGANVAICVNGSDTTATPCASLVKLCTTLTDTTCNAPNPTQADGLGNFSFYIPTGTVYTRQIYGSGLTTYISPDQAASSNGGVNCQTSGAAAIPYYTGVVTLCDPGIQSNGSGTLSAVNLSATTGITTPVLNMAGGAGFLIGPFQKQTAPLNPASGSMVCWGDSGTNFFACKNSDGSNAMPSGGGGSLTTSVNGVNLSSQSVLNFSNPSSFNGLTFTYSNPSSGNLTFAVGGTLNNAGLTNSATTVNGQTCTLGSTCSVASGLLASSGPQTAITGTGSSVNVYSFSVPGGTMSTTSCVRATVLWQHSTGAGTITYTWNFGTSAFTGTSASTGVSRSVFTVCNNGSTNSQFMDAFEDAHSGANAPFTAPQNGTAALDSTVSQTLSFQFSGAGSESITPKSWVVENVH